MPHPTTFSVESNTKNFSAPHITLPWFHRHFLLSTKIQLPFFLSPKTAPPPPRRDFTSSEAKLKYNTSTLTAFGIPTPQSVTPFPYIYIYRRLLPRWIPCFTTKPCWLGRFLWKHFSWPLWPSRLSPFPSQWISQHCRVTSTTRSYCFYATSSTPSSTHHFPLGFPVRHWLTPWAPSSLFQYRTAYSSTWLLSLLGFPDIYIELRKVKSHTGMPGNARADLIASKGITSCTPIGRFATFPPPTLPVLSRMDTPSSAPDSLKIVQVIASSSDECFPKTPYCSQTLHLIGFHLTYFSIAPDIFHWF